MQLIEADTDLREAKAAHDAIEPYKPSISIVGLGPIGVECVAGYAGQGFRVVGVDIDLAKIRAVKDGKSPLADGRCGEAIADGVARGRIEATQNIVAAVVDTDVTMMPVSGSDMAFVRAASRAIGQALSLKDGYHAIVLTGFTEAEGIVETVARECGTASGKRLGVDFGICVSPELWRSEDAAVDDGWPARSMVRASDAQAAQVVAPLFAEMTR